MAAVDLDLGATGEKHRRAVGIPSERGTANPTRLPDRRASDDVKVRAERRHLDLERWCATRLLATARRAGPIDEAHEAPRAINTFDRRHFPTSRIARRPSRAGRHETDERSQPAASTRYRLIRKHSERRRLLL